MRSAESRKRGEIPARQSVAAPMDVARECNYDDFAELAVTRGAVPCRGSRAIGSTHAAALAHRAHPCRPLQHRRAQREATPWRFPVAGT